MPMTFAAIARQKALLRIHHEFSHANPSVARSLEEGMEETLTLHRLQVPIEL